MEFCQDTANIWQFVGYILMVFKIIIPILLIVFGMLDLGKAVISSKSEEIKKSTGSLVRRAVAGILVFFLPTIITYLFNLLTPLEPWEGCKTCVVDPTGIECSGWVSLIEVK